MSHSNTPSHPAGARVTLKLKTPARKNPVEKKQQQIAPPQSKAQTKPGARWSDEYKERMQADMDQLASR